MLLVSFHGGKDGERDLRAYRDDGTPIVGPVLAKVDALAQPAELRGLSFAPDGSLWVLNGAKESSEILRFTGSKPPYAPAGRLASYPSIDSLWHPFDLTFSNPGSTFHCFVSNQDTNVVARLMPSPDGKRMIAAPVAKALPPGKSFLEGTFVASSVGKLPGVKCDTYPIATAAGGLDVKLEQHKVKHSVRGVVWAREALYVADEPGNAVKAYDETGAFLGASSFIEGPVHLLQSQGFLYATSANGVFRAPLDPRLPVHLTFPSSPTIALKGASGMAFAPSGELYVADRLGSSIHVYPAAGSSARAVSFPVPNEPEFILHATG